VYNIVFLRLAILVEVYTANENKVTRLKIFMGRYLTTAERIVLIGLIPPPKLETEVLTFRLGSGEGYKSGRSGSRHFKAKTFRSEMKDVVPIHRIRNLFEIGGRLPGEATAICRKVKTLRLLLHG